MPSHEDDQRSSELSLADQVLDMIQGVANTQAMFVVAKLGIADLLEDRPKTVQELARATQTHAPSLHRVMRALVNQGIFDELEAGKFALSPSSELLRTNAQGSVRAYAIMSGSGYQLSAWANLLHSVETGQPAFKYTHGKNSFEYYAENKEESQVFHEAMTAISKMDATIVCDAYDFSEMTTITDVGGGHGYLLATILRADPTKTGTLFDLPSVAAAARGYLEAQGLTDRCKIVSGDFLESVPAGGGVYILKRVLPAFEDKTCETILKNCREAMAPDGRLLIADCNAESRYGNLYDLRMMAMTDGGQTRTEAEHRYLLSRAGFNFNRVVPTNSYLSIFEALPR